MLHLILRVALMVLALLFVVPAVTGNKVAVRQGSFGKGLLAYLVLGLFNSALWFVSALATVGGVGYLNLITFGIVGLLINALAFVVTSKLLPDTLYVEDYGSAIWASLAMTVSSYLIHLLV